MTINNGGQEELLQNQRPTWNIGLAVGFDLYVVK